MGSKQSTANSPSRVVSRENTISGSYSTSAPFRGSSHATEATEQLNNGRDTNWRQRARSLTAVISGDARASHSSAIDVLSPFGMSPTSTSDILSVSSSNDDHLSASYGYTAHSLPVHFFPINGNYILFCFRFSFLIIIQFNSNFSL